MSCISNKKIYKTKSISSLNSNSDYVKVTGHVLSMDVEIEKIKCYRDRLEAGLKGELDLIELERESNNLLLKMDNYVIDIIYNMYEEYIDRSKILYDEDKQYLLFNLKSMITKYVSTLTYYLYTIGNNDFFFNSMKVHVNPLKDVDIKIQRYKNIYRSPTLKTFKDDNSKTIEKIDKTMDKIDKIDEIDAIDDELENNKDTIIEEHSIKSIFYLEKENRSRYLYNLKNPDNKKDIIFDRGDKFKKGFIIIPPSVWKVNDACAYYYLDYKGKINIYTEL
jgi:hypothetical protein